MSFLRVSQNIQPVIAPSIRYVFSRGGVGGGGGGGSATNFHTVQPLTLLYTIFERKGTPFICVLLPNGTHFTF